MNIREVKQKNIKTERETNHKKLKYRGQTEGFWWDVGWGEELNR